VESEWSGWEVHLYTYLHAAPPKGITYYRLQQVDKDGRITLSRLISVFTAGASSSQTLSVFPNPASQDKLYVLLTPSVTQGTIARLFDPMGHMIQEALADESGMAFDIQHLPAGLYLVWIETEGNSHTARVVIE
jgi:hypothetical protein